MLQGTKLTGTREPSKEVEIGWHFHPGAWVHGYATEVANLVMQHGFQSGMEGIIAVVHTENAASSRVCLRLGMANEGMTKNHYDSEYELFSAERECA